nr:hypothetical protein [Nocardioidaceae bacterium]
MATQGLDSSDSLLFDEMRRGSSAALAALFDRHADAVYNYRFRRTASSARRLTRVLRRVPHEGAAPDGDDMADRVVRRVDSERQMAAVLAAIAALPQ